MEAALGALCRAGGWSYAAVWRFHPQDPRLLTLGDCYCEDEAKTMVQKMLNLVEIVGEGILGEALVSGECQWIYDDTCHALNQTSHAQTSHAHNRDLYQGYTWWQHQFLNGIKTIAVLPLQLQGLVQFGSTRKVPRSSVFSNQVRDIFDRMKNASSDGPMEYTQNNSLAYGQQPILTSLRSANDMLAHNKVNPLQTEKLEENIERIESIRSSICSPSNSQRSLNDLTSHGTGNASMDTHILAMPVNSKTIYELKRFDNVTELFHQSADDRVGFQVNSSKEPGSIIAGVMSGYKSSNNIHRTEDDSCDQNTEYTPYLYTTTNSANSGLDELSYSGTGLSSSFTAVSGRVKNCLQTESDKFLCKSVSFSSNPCASKIQENRLSPYQALMNEQSLIPDNPGESVRLLSHEESSIVQGDSMQFKDTTHFTCQDNRTFPELPNRSPEEATPETLENNMKDCSGNNSLLETMMLDLSTNSFVQDWWDDSVLLAENLPNSTEKHSEPAIELANRHSLPTGERGLPFIDGVEHLLGDVAHPPARHSSLEADATALAGCVSDYQLPQLAFRDCLTAHNAQVPSLACSNYTSRTGTAENGSSEVPSANISVDDTCSFNTANSKGSQSSNPEGMKVAKRRARAGESTRPRPKDRQLIQDRVKELREIVPNGAKCSIDALLERTIKHMLFLQSVNKYAEKIKQVDEPKIIDKESGVVLKDKPDAGKNGGATWAYEVAGQTMVCPIIIEDLSPPGQMLVEMLCEERGLFLEIADNIRGFGLTILKGQMELRDGKIWSRFLVEANREVTRMDIFLSLVQLLEQNSLVRSTEQMAKVKNNGVPSFANHQRSPLPVPVGIAERLQ